MDPSTSTTLARLLNRLDQNLLSPESDALPRIRSSQYERNKVAANIEHARTMLLTLEKQASTIRTQSERQRVQTDLMAKREVVKRLGGRLDELNQMGDAEEDSDEDEDEDEEGQIVRQPSFAPARSDAQDGLDAGGGGGEETANIQDAAQQLQSELRSRKPPSAADNRDAASTTAREALFANRSSTGVTSNSNDPSLSEKETLLSHNRTEQESLTNGLLSLARALKESSLQFSSSLESEKDVLKRAEGGLDKSAIGMEAAERKMGLLRRMSEGQGWWGRIKLYGMIGGLWVAAFLLVFVGPKIRF